MSYTALARAFRQGLSRVQLALKLVNTLGVGFAATRARLACEHSLGIPKRKTPVGSWDSAAVEGNGSRIRAALDTDSVREFYSHRPQVFEILAERQKRLSARQFDIFGTLCAIESWHHDPIADLSYSPSDHWSEVPEFGGADLKVVWEPSRFSWAYDLAILHVLDPEGSAASQFWELFEDWCDANQPNSGVNWQCGQESSIRFMAIMFATQAFGDTGSAPHREELLASFAEVTARRVLAHWRYAQSQLNNHVVSEAVGLLSVAAFFPGLSVSDEAWATGERLLVESCESLVFPDGSTSQYSLNYHRVFLDNFIWARFLFSVRGIRAPGELDDALARSAAFLEAVTDPEDGIGPFFGHNDGARLLPTPLASFGDFRTTLVASRAVRGLTFQRGADTAELACWFPQISRTAGQPARLFTRFPDAGISILGSGDSRATVRGGKYMMRPAHSDQLHVDVWLDGNPVFVDPGTWSYKPGSTEPDLALSRYHNGPIVSGSEDMTRATRFLWLDWSSVTVELVDAPNRLWVGKRLSPATGMVATRRIEGTADSWTITDVVALSRPQWIETNWCLPVAECETLPRGVQFKLAHNRYAMTTSIYGGASLCVNVNTDQFICHNYRQRGVGSLVTMRFKAGTRSRMTTKLYRLATAATLPDTTGRNADTVPRE